eukprot:Skav218693  [mRNA]  locus=scaffold1346:145670:150848:- [translate_table: standard]
MRLRTRLGCAVRWGEATNPGPVPCILRLGILNPTSIKSKSDKILHFMEHRHVDTLCLAETTATLDTQKSITTQMTRKHVKCIWSSPVASQCNTNTNAECERGKPGGVAVFSKYPIRACLNPMPLELKMSTRFVHSIATVGQMQFQLVTCYGYPQNRTAAKEDTNQLLQAVLEQVQQLPLPFLVAGDFNAELGDYDPPHEVTSFGAKSKIKQIRRLQSLTRQLKAHAQDSSEKWYRCGPTLRVEWKKILQSHAFGMPFHQWLWEHPDIGQIPWPLPSHTWLFQVQQLAKFEVDACVAADRAATLAFLKSKQDTPVDKQSNLKRAFHYVKTYAKPPIRELVQSFHTTCAATWISPTQVSIAVEVDQLQLGTPIQIDDGLGWITGTSETAAHITLSKLPKEQSAAPRVTQTKQITDPNAMVDQLNSFWLPIWQNEEVPTACQLEQFDQLVNTLPFSIPPIDIDTGEEVWCAAVKRLKGSTARGFDALSGWEAKLLPACFWKQLAKCILGYHDGLPDWLMKARTCPLSKVDATPDAAQVRPITVLPLIYRIYASVVCRQILWSWHQHFPMNITGLLPTRGAFDAAYNSQMLLEAAHASGQQMSGLTLDLKKAFNLIWHHVGPPLLRKFGVPPDIVTRWAASIGKLTRYWDVLQGTYGPFHTSRGYPEGDSHSVLAMLAISLLWVFTVKCGPDGEPLQVEPTAYADNWGWSTCDPELHSPTITSTLSVTGLCGLSVDWNKTWMFATSTKTAQAASQSLLQAIPEVDLPRPHHAKDLGLELCYSGAHRLGHRPERHQEGFRRLKKLQHLPADPELKETVWLSSIYPACFHGAETCPPAEDLVQRIRARVADAIYGASHSMAPSVALLLGKRHLLDPGFQLIIHAVRAARRWLHAASAAQRQQFFNLVATFRGGIAKVKGPAAALSLYLKQLEWDLTRDGTLLCGAFLRLHLVDTAFGDIVNFAQQAWQHDLFLKFTERKSLYHLKLSRTETIQALNQFHGKERGNLVRELAGAFQCATQKAKWSEAHSGNCPFCGQEDTRQHRLFECPTFSDIREPFSEHVTWLLDNFPLTAELPGILVHEDAEVHQLLQYHDSDAIVGAEFFHVVQERAERGLPVYLYTDGSGKHPNAPATRYCSFAVVMDLCETDQQRCAYAHSYLVTGALPESLQTVCCARVKGRQTVPRAELAALEVASRFHGAVVAYSDSQSALSAIHHLQAGTFDFLKGNNLDLARLIQGNLRPGQEFRKIKAHTDLTTYHDMLALYHALGNLAADQAAGGGCDEPTDFRRSLEQRHQQQDCYIGHMRGLYRMILTLQTARQQAEVNFVQQQEHDARLEVAQASGSVAILARFSPHPGRRQQFDNNREPMFDLYPWGPQMARSFRDWFTELVWATGEAIPPCCRGVSWLELALSFSWYLSALLPVLRDDDQGVRQLVMVSCKQDLATFHVTLGDLSRCMQNLWTHFSHMLPPELQPPVERGLNRSLMWYGFQQHVSGLSVRPRFPGQAQVVGFLDSALPSRSSYDCMLEIPWIQETRCWPLEQHPWLFLRDLANRRRLKFLRELAG